MGRSEAAVHKPAFKDTFELVGRSQTSSKEQKQGKVCYVDVFKLKDLPDVMDKKGWTVSAALMRKWFGSSGREMRDEEKSGIADSRSYPHELVDTTTVTMAWALSFARIKREYDSIFGTSGLIRSTPPKYESVRARAELVHKLAKAGKFTLHTEKFGNLQSSVLNIDEEYQFQFHSVDDNTVYAKAWLKDTLSSDPSLDDMWGALARFTFKIAAEGTVKLKTRVVDVGLQCKLEAEYYEISVEKIGVYVRDTYDFKGAQYLGHWSKTAEPHIRAYPGAYAAGDRSPSGECPNDFVCVDNADFRKHRDLTGTGGDLLIFSDIFVTTLKRPFVFRVTPAGVAKASTSGAR